MSHQIRMRELKTWKWSCRNVLNSRHHSLFGRREGYYVHSDVPDLTNMQTTLADSTAKAV